MFESLVNVPLAVCLGAWHVRPNGCSCRLFLGGDRGCNAASDVKDRCYSVGTKVEGSIIWAFFSPHEGGGGHFVCLWLGWYCVFRSTRMFSLGTKSFVWTFSLISLQDNIFAYLCWPLHMFVSPFFLPVYTCRSVPWTLLIITHPYPSQKKA